MPIRLKSLIVTAVALTAPFASLAQESVATQVFQVNSDASWLRVLAYPDGPLKRFGHRHVIAHHAISGSVDVASNPLESSFVLELAVNDLSVDDADQRALEGEEFEAEVPQKDIDGTRRNMLSDGLLDGESYPTIRLVSSAIEGSLPDVEIVTTLTVKGADYTVRFPATVELTDDAFMASGELEILHGPLGLSPFTAMGGALSVRDLLVLKYEISGTRVIDAE